MDELAEAVWDGRPPASARKLVQEHVSQLRRALRSGVDFVTRAEAYAAAQRRAKACALDAVGAPDATSRPDVAAWVKERTRGSLRRGVRAAYEVGRSAS